jgi:Ca2+-binding RTX toxin-like protein
MLLNFLLTSAYDEGLTSTANDSSSRTLLYRVEYNRASYGSIGGPDTTDIYSVRPGPGFYNLFVSADSRNGFSTHTTADFFDVKLINSNGTTSTVTSTVVDATTRALSFGLATDGIFYIEITSFSPTVFAYVATLSSPSYPILDLLPPQLFGTDGADSIVGTSVREEITPGPGDDSVSGGGGEDTIGDQSGSNYLRGDDGNDIITGGLGFDDINGNMGDDTCSGSSGDDWVVGGKNNDRLLGLAGDDLVYGNLGDDTCDGGAGNDIVRGGQENDVIVGGAGDDYVSGDKGDDTVTGGLGADDFHSFGEAGLDRVTDFNRVEGDRVRLDPGTEYSVSQVGADTVIDMVGGGKMVLVGVSMGSLTGTWLFMG